MKDLDNLINFIQNKYDEISNNWENDSNYYPLNMQTSRVENIYHNKDMLIYVFNYRNFVDKNTLKITEELQKINLNSGIDTRVKALNSIQDKIERYEIKAEKGKIPLKKCLNDIFGLRIILDGNISYDDIREYISNKFPNIKCIDSSKDKYKAIHVYFGNDDNKRFQWELQIWKKDDEYSNLLSHEKYKQEYTKWERLNIKEG